MKYKILKNKKFHIPTDLIKEARKSAKMQEELEKKINEMTNEEYEIYINKELAEAEIELERQIEEGTTIPYETVMNELKENIKLLNKRKIILKYHYILIYEVKENIIYISEIFNSKKYQ